jgi:hypothetical protein
MPSPPHFLDLRHVCQFTRHCPPLTYPGFLHLKKTPSEFVDLRKGPTRHLMQCQEVSRYGTKYCFQQEFFSWIEEKPYFLTWQSIAYFHDNRLHYLPIGLLIVQWQPQISAWEGRGDHVWTGEEIQVSVRIKLFSLDKHFFSERRCKHRDII